MSETHLDPRLDWDLADRLRKALRVADVSVGEMADYLGVSRNTVGRYINGHVTPDRRTLMLWAMRTGTPMDWLAFGISAPGEVYAHTPDRPAGMSGQPDPGYAEVASPLDEFRKRLPLTSFVALLAVAA